MRRWREKLSSLKMPHTYVILLAVVVLCYLIPAGEYDRVVDPSSGNTVVLPDSFHFTQGKRPGLFDIFLALQRGYVDAADILFLIVFAYGYVYMLTKNGTLNNAIHVLIRRMKDKTYLLIPVFMMLFGILGSTLGIFEETYGLVSVFVGIGLALGYDGLVGGAVVYVGVATGFAAATTNPFSVGIAQSIAEVPINSGLLYRLVIFLVFQSASIWYVMRYAKKVKAHPEKSVMYGVPMEFTPPDVHDTNGEFTLRQKLCLLLFFVTIVLLLFGTMKLGWYINEIAAMFLMMAVVTGIVSGYSATEICNTYIESTKSVVSSILIIGFTRGILLTMQDAMISDTVVYGLSKLLDSSNKMISAVGMLVLQNVINFFITGSSSQATITMPIMTPVADIVGLNRQTAVLAYCFGDGFSDMFWPTACTLNCGLMGIPLNKWYKFIGPLFLIMVVLQVLFIALSVWIYP